MALLGVLRVFIFLLLTIGLRTTEAVMVIVGDPFEFPSTCDRSQSGSLRMNLGQDGTRDVADFRSGVWKPLGEYRDRIRRNSSKIVFTRTQFTDGGGIYELSCGKAEPQLLQLQMVFAAEISVMRGESVLLPCYFNMKPGSSVIWIKDRSVLCQLKSGSGVCSGRLSVSPDWSSHGNLSLTLDQAHPEDQGVYSCFIQDKLSKKQSGSPAAVRLVVRDTDRQTRTTPSPEQKTQMEHCHDLVIVISILGTLLVVAVCLLFTLGWHLHAHRSKFPLKPELEDTSSYERQTLWSSPEA